MGKARQPVRAAGHIELIPTQRDQQGVQKPLAKPASIRKHGAIGAVIGFALDVAVVAATLHIVANADPYCDGTHRC